MEQKAIFKEKRASRKRNLGVTVAKRGLFFSEIDTCYFHLFLFLLLFFRFRKNKFQEVYSAKKP
jgi:hypothetical protein